MADASPPTTPREGSHSVDRPRGLSLGLTQFDFCAKTAQAAEEALLLTRSDTFNPRTPPPDQDIWKKAPPDFRHVVFEPRPPKRNTVDSQQPWRYGTIPGQRQVIKRERGSLMPLLFREPSPSAPSFLTRFRIPRPYTAKKEFVKKGMNPVGEYISPKPHDFRQYPTIKSLGLEEFVTSYERDPYNLTFKSQHLDTIHGAPPGATERDLKSGRQMAPPLSPKPKWDARLILEKTSWPQRFEGFTRHRLRYRNPYSAFMERVEYDIKEKWMLEKMLLELAIQKSSDHRSVDEQKT